LRTPRGLNSRAPPEPSGAGWLPSFPAPDFGAFAVCKKFGSPEKGAPGLAVATSRFWLGGCLSRIGRRSAAVAMGALHSRSMDTVHFGRAPYYPWTDPQG